MVIEEYDLVLGQVVKSKAGRDKGNVFIVVDVLSKDYVLIADGEIRKIERPKKKKVKHLIKYNAIEYEIRDKLLEGKKVQNSEIKKTLEKYKS